MIETPKRRGRPSKGADAKRAPLNLRTSPGLRTKIEEAASLSGRPLTQEVEHRLELSFAQDEALGGAQTAAFVRMVGGALARIEWHAGHKWFEHETSWRAASDAIVDLLTSMRPPAANPYTEMPSDFEREAKRGLDHVVEQFMVQARLVAAQTLAEMSGRAVATEEAEGKRKKSCAVSGRGKGE